jgi:imidazolonepropionase-like amidohydrolase/Tol biopolymer transport system component
MHKRHWHVKLLALATVVGIVAISKVSARTLELHTKEITDPDLALSPDGRHLIFTSLGHLFRISVEGGDAEQLTFGPYFDNEPAFSPDGGRLAFVSDRDGSAGNLFLLDLSTRATKQLTHEPHAGQPVWSRDGKSIAYCRILAREEHPPQLLPRFFGASGLREVRTIAVDGGDAAIIATPRLVSALFYLNDGRLAWSVNEQSGAPAGPFPGRSSTKIEAKGLDGLVTTLRTAEGLGRVVVSPAGDGLYYVSGGLRLLPLPEGEPRSVVTFASGQAGARFVIALDNKSAYVAQEGQVSQIDFATGQRHPVGLDVHIKMEVKDQVRPKWVAPRNQEPARFRSVMSPQVAPDGTRLVFMAGGDLWQQTHPDGRAERLFGNNALVRDPSVSPDGRWVALAQNAFGTRQVVAYDFSRHQMRLIASMGDRAWGLSPSWSHDGSRLVFQQSDALFSPIALMALGHNGAAPEKVSEGSVGWTARPHFSRDDRSLYFTARTASLGALYRVGLDKVGTAVAVTDLTGHLSDGLVSPDGKWLAFRRNAEIWAAPLGAEPVKEDAARRLSSEGGRNFSFTADSSALIYAAGARVWRQPLDGSKRVEIPLRIELTRAEPPPLLLRRVRILDFDARKFGPETTLLIEQGRIRSIGSDMDSAIPPSTSVVDCNGRYAIPGLFDLHVHSAWSNFETNPDAFIAFGITSVRDTGGRLDLLNSLADRSELTGQPLPRYFYSGEIFEGVRPNWGDAFLLIASEDDARAHVRKWKEWGAHFIKVYPSLPWPLQRVVADEARRLGLPMVGHGLSTEEIVKSVTLGYSVLEHAPGSIYEDILALLAAAGTRWDPTLAIMGGHTLLQRGQPERLDEAAFRTFVPETAIREAKGGGLFGRMPESALRASWKARLARVRAAGDQGVGLQAGTDSLMTGTFFGPSLHWELEHFVEAGFTPLEVIRMATASAAECVGAQDDLGIVAAGKLADLVLLDANPLEKIRNTQSIWRVIKGGWIFDPQKLRNAAATQ